MAELHDAGVDRFAVNAFHGAKSLSRAIDDHAPATIETHLFVEKQLMGTAGGLLAPRELLDRDELFVLHNGDTLVHPPIDQLAQAASGPKCLGAILVRPGRTGTYRVLRIEDGRLVGRETPQQLESDPHGDHAANYLGVAVLRRELFEQIPSEGPSELFDLMLPLLESGWTLAAVPYVGSWLEFTSPYSYRENLLRLLAQADACRVELPGGAAKVSHRGSGTVFVDESADVATGVRFEGPCIVESGARVEPGAVLQTSLVLEDAKIAAGAYVSESVVASHTVLRRTDIFRRGVIAMGAESHERPGTARYLPFASPR